MQNFSKMFADPSKKKNADILQNFCSPHNAEFLRKNGQQIFYKISVASEISIKFL